MEITSGGYSETLCRKNRTNISALSNGEKWHFGRFSRMGHIIVQGQNLSYSACTRNTHSLWHTHTVCTWEFGLPTDRDQGSNRTWQCSHTHTHTHTHTHCCFGVSSIATYSPKEVLVRLSSSITCRVRYVYPLKRKGLFIS